MSSTSCPCIGGLSLKARVHGLGAQRSQRLESLLKEEKQLQGKQEREETIGDDGCRHEFVTATFKTPSVSASQFRYDRGNFAP